MFYKRENVYPWHASWVKTGYISNATYSDDHLLIPDNSNTHSPPTPVTAYSTKKALHQCPFSYPFRYCPLSYWPSPHLFPPTDSQCTFSYLFSLPLLTTPLPSPHHLSMFLPWPPLLPLLHFHPSPPITTYSPHSPILPPTAHHHNHPFLSCFYHPCSLFCFLPNHDPFSFFSLVPTITVNSCTHSPIIIITPHAAS